MRTIDAHVHVWELDRLEYGWLTAAAGPLFRDVTVEETLAATSDAGVDGVVLVQAADSIVETRWLADIARSTAAVLGVVGWLPIGSPERVAAALDTEFVDALCGVRALVHDSPDDGLLTSQPVIETVRLLGRRGLAFDVPDAFPRLATATCGLLRAAPHSVIVIDHLGKPGPNADLDAWADWIRRVAAHPNSVGKLSGFVPSGKGLPAAVVARIVDVALEAFGPDRLLFGSDWPLSATGAGYRDVLDVTTEAISALSEPERAAVLAGTAARVYGFAVV